MVVKATVKDLAPKGVINYDRIYSECSSIALVKKIHGEAVTATMVYLLIEDCSNAFNTYTKMNKYQIMDVVDEILEDLNIYTLEDLSIFFSGVKRGYWGSITNRFDAGIIWDLWEQYSRQRAEHFYKKASSHSTNVQEEKRTGEIFLGKGRKKSDTEFLNKIIRSGK